MRFVVELDPESAALLTRHQQQNPNIDGDELAGKAIAFYLSCYSKNDLAIALTAENAILREYLSMMLHMHERVSPPTFALWWRANAPQIKEAISKL